MLIDKMPLLKGRVGYYPMPEAIEQTKKDEARYAQSDVAVYFQKDIDATIGYLPLNVTESYGRLRLMNLEEQPSSRDIVLYRSLPNEMPRVAGVITAVRQTPLSHVNLRAVQDGVPNAFIANAAEQDKIKSLIGKFVYYRVGAGRLRTS